MKELKDDANQASGTAATAGQGNTSQQPQIDNGLQVPEYGSGTHASHAGNMLYGPNAFPDTMHGDFDMILGPSSQSGNGTDGLDTTHMPPLYDPNSPMLQMPQMVQMHLSPENLHEISMHRQNAGPQFDGGGQGSVEAFRADTSRTVMPDQMQHLQMRIEAQPFLANNGDGNMRMDDQFSMSSKRREMNEDWDFEDSDDEDDDGDSVYTEEGIQSDKHYVSCPALLPRDNHNPLDTALPTNSHNSPARTKRNSSAAPTATAGVQPSPLPPNKPPVTKTYKRNSGVPSTS